MKMDLARASLFMKAKIYSAALLCLLASTGMISGQVQRIPGHTPANMASPQGTVRDSGTKVGIPGVKGSLLRAGIVVREKSTDGEGIFRFIDLASGIYELKAEKQGFQEVQLPSLQIKSPET